MLAVLDTILRTLIAFLLILLISRILGKQTAARMTNHDYVAAITLGSITANLAFNSSLKAGQLIASLLTFALVAFAFSFIALNSRSARRLISGKPTVIIQEGKLLEDHLKKLRLNLDTLNQELREKDIFDIQEVEYAVLELNGRISVLLKPEHRQVARKDLKLPNLLSSFPVELIMDGRIIDENLRQNRLTPEWLNGELFKQGITLDQVFYAVRSTDGTLFCDLHKDRISNPIDAN